MQSELEVSVTAELPLRSYRKAAPRAASVSLAGNISFATPLLGTLSQGDCSPVQGLLLVAATLLFVVSQVPLALVTYKGMKSVQKKTPPSRGKKLSPGELALLAFLPGIGLLILIALPYTRRKEPGPSDDSVVEVSPLWPNAVMLYSEYKKLADPRFKAELGVSWMFPYEPVLASPENSARGHWPEALDKAREGAKARAKSREEAQRLEEHAARANPASKRCNALTTTGGSCRRPIAPGRKTCGIH